jgi:5-methylcytosine-specific restriction endonuclease McrA
MVASVLQRPTLVLNRNWQPVNVATVSRALTMLWNESARVVDPHDYQMYDWADWSRLAPRGDEPFIQAVRSQVRVPEVIALNGYDRLPSAAVSFSRRNIFKRDHYTCQYCGVQPGSEELTIDHVVPRAQGGISSWTNCVLACVACNKRKADRTPGAGGSAPAQAADPSDLEAALRLAVGADRKLVEVRQRSVLERGVDDGVNTLAGSDPRRGSAGGAVPTSHERAPG